MHPDFHTTDICLAAYLKCNNFALKDIIKYNAKGTFVFAVKSDEDSLLISGFDLGNARVEPIAFHNTIRQLTTAVRRIV